MRAFKFEVVVKPKKGKDYSMGVIMKGDFGKEKAEQELETWLMKKKVNWKEYVFKEEVI